MFLEQLEFWHWWVLALIFVGAEIFVPGAVLVWLGAASAVVGIVLLGFPDLSWKFQFLIWAVISIGSVVVSRTYLKRNPIETDRPNLNRRGEQYVGRLFTLEEPVVNGLGKIRVDDSTWKVEAENDLPAGAKIKVVGIEGTIFKVDPA